ncbi:hypothetical protein F5Y14DRAFT_424844 [Nemania sp. NC0429]|nr:hypothetical protein F5Y14DRAFT_424844 [Nemania sp. NC0429]
MGEGAISAAIRFLCHLPFGYYAFTGVSKFEYIRDHMGVLLAPPLGHHIFVGEVFSGPIGVIGFFWNFFLWIPTISTTGGGLFLLGVVDAIVTGFIIISLAIEASFIGFTPGQCAQLGPNATPNSNLIFFQRVAEIEFKDKGVGEATCKEYYAKWYVGLVLAILYALSATANMVIGSRSGYNHGNYQSSYSRNRGLGHCLLSPVPPIMGIMRGLAEIVSSLLPSRLYYSLSVTGRHVKQWFRYRASRTKQKAPESHILVTQHASHVGLYSVLSHDAVLERIARQLHYVDAVNLSLASRRMREAMFPRQKSSLVEEKQLRYYSCVGGKKTDCWACGIQICDECSKSSRCPKSTVSFHMSLCAAACSNCYRKKLSRSYFRSHSCSCRDGRQKNPAYSYTYGGGYLNPSDPRLVCRDCHAMTDDEMQALREKRDKAMYTNLSQQPLSCTICSESLPRTGPRWWICSKCKMECRSRCHVDWSQRLDEC